MKENYKILYEDYLKGKIINLKIGICFINKLCIHFDRIINGKIIFKYSGLDFE